MSRSFNKLNLLRTLLSYRILRALLEDGIEGGHDERGDENGEEQAANEISELPFSRSMLQSAAHTANKRSIHSERSILSLMVQLPVELFPRERWHGKKIDACLERQLSPAAITPAGLR
ncbi:MAG: hypothetical protein ACRD4K_07675 [Candidatus Acidiferrales bacterium]